MLEISQPSELTLEKNNNEGLGKRKPTKLDFDDKNEVTDNTEVSFRKKKPKLTMSIPLINDNINRGQNIDQNSQEKKPLLNIGVINKQYKFNEYINYLQVPDPNHSQSQGIPLKKDSNNKRIESRDSGRMEIETPTMKNGKKKIDNFDFDDLINL